jgi:hypothetical protein
MRTFFFKGNSFPCNSWDIIFTEKFYFIVYLKFVLSQLSSHLPNQGLEAVGAFILPREETAKASERRGYSVTLWKLSPRSRTISGSFSLSAE